MNALVLFYSLSIPLLSSFNSCSIDESTNNKKEDIHILTEFEGKPIGVKYFDSIGSSIQTRINLLKGFERKSVESNSYAFYLRNLKLKPIGSKVKYFNGQEKDKNDVYCAVVDLPIGKQDLHQCADAVMHVWARYLFEQKRFNEIQFKFLGDNAWHNFAKWSSGDYSDKNFWKYIQQVWSAANTRSLHGQLNSITIDQAKIGDVFIQTGNPYGHAIVIVDECINIETGDKQFLLAQSYMPAQDLQILQNPNNKENPWYSFKNKQVISTPEWEFTIDDLKRF